MEEEHGISPESPESDGKIRQKHYIRFYGKKTPAVPQELILLRHDRYIFFAVFFWGVPLKLFKFLGKITDVFKSDFKSDLQDRQVGGF
jgi:hypothetical protein